MNPYFEKLQLIVGIVNEEAALTRLDFFENRSYLPWSGGMYRKLRSGTKAFHARHHETIIDCLNRFLEDRFASLKNKPKAIDNARRRLEATGYVDTGVSPPRVNGHALLLEFAQQARSESIRNLIEHESKHTMALDSILDPQMADKLKKVEFSVPPNINHQDLVKMKAVVTALGKIVDKAIIESMKKGNSIHYTLMLSEASALKLKEALESGKLDSALGGPLLSLRVEDAPRVSAYAPGRLLCSSKAPPTDADLYHFMAWHGQAITAGWLWPRIKDCTDLLITVLASPLRTFTVPLARYYFVPTLLAGGRNRSLYAGLPITRKARKDALINAFVLWPLMATCATVILCGVLTQSWDIGTLVWASATASIMAMAGSLVCGPLFSILGVGAGGVAFGIAFGLVQALLAKWTPNGLAGLVAFSLPPAVVSPDPMRAHEFVGVVNGVIGISATEINTVARKIAALAPPSLAILSTAWLMGNPASADQSDQSVGWKRCLAGGLVGTFGGGGIGLVQLIFASLRGSIDPRMAFCVAAAVIGGLAYALSVWLRTRSVRKAFSYGALYAGVGATLWGATMLWTGTVAGLVIGALGTAFFHACYFTLSYAIGFAIGGRRAAFIAAGVEGMVGFVVFNLLLMK